MTDRGLAAQYLDVEDSFEAVYIREFAYVWRTVRRLGVPHDDIPDAVHDVFVVVYRRWNDYDPSRPIGPWLFGIARRVAAAKRRSPQAEDGRTADVDRPSGDKPADETAAQRQLLWAALREMPEERVLVFILHDLEGYSAPEIAAMLEVPVNTVYSRVRLAREDATAVVARLRRENLP